jgi:hypothetical protein
MSDHLGKIPPASASRRAAVDAELDVPGRRGVELKVAQRVRKNGLRFKAGDPDFGVRDRQQEHVVTGEERPIRPGAKIVERHWLEVGARIEYFAAQCRPGERREADRREAEGERSTGQAVAIGIQRLSIPDSQNRRAIDVRRDPRAARHGGKWKQPGERTVVGLTMLAGFSFQRASWHKWRP